MATNKNLKAYVRYDGSGRAIAGSLILQRKKPLVGNWKETSAYECCDPSCLPLVYGQDFIIDDIYSAGDNLIVLIETAPGVSIQAGFFSCTSTALIPVLSQDVVSTSKTAPTSYVWIIPNSLITIDVCALGFRRICDNTYNLYSGWNFSWD